MLVSACKPPWVRPPAPIGSEEAFPFATKCGGGRFARSLLFRLGEASDALTSFGLP